MKSITVTLAFSNQLFSEGIKALIDSDQSITVGHILKPGSVCDNDCLAGLEHQVILTDFTTLYNAFPGIESMPDHPPVILFDTDCGRENIVAAVLKKKINGVLLGNSTPALLKKAVHAVSGGEIWIDKTTVKSLLKGISALGGKKASILTDREKEIVALAGDGYRNKEIAQRLNVTESTIKTHMQRIFQKLAVRNRSELITYAIKNNDIPSPGSKSVNAVRG
jgi:DNA-binding NarL/FixJ family response regulator